MKKKQQTILLILGLFLLTPVVIVAVRYGFEKKETHYPRVVNMFLPWDVSDKEARELSQWDMVVLHPIAAERNDDLLYTIKKRNPRVKLLVYIPLTLIPDAFINSKDSFSQELLSKIEEHNWWLRSSAGVVTHADASLADLTPGENTWNDFLSQYVYDHYLFEGSLWDGVYYDNAWNSLDWLSPEFSSKFNKEWFDGVAKILSTTQRLAPEKTMTINTGLQHFQFNSLVNGKVYEFSRYSPEVWPGVLHRYVEDSFELVPKTSIFSSFNNDYKQEREFRFAYTSALLGDGYFGFTNENFNTLWWFDEYEMDLGAPISNVENVITGEKTITAAGVWKREFEKGFVLVNATIELQEVSVSGQLLSIPSFDGEIVFK